jgi:16S rRNA (adenine1518-N6/adenine1519-N6)-dimethyltransferase
LARRRGRGLTTRKRFGQHFLEPAWVDKVIRAIDPKPDETFIEIGPGRGALTRPLAARAKQVAAYEIDRDLAAALRAARLANVEIVEGDFLDTVDAPPVDVRGSAALRAAGNLPYNVASPILFKLIELFDRGVPLIDATVMVQREVADRLVAAPGTKEYGALTVLVGHSADVERLLDLPPGAFRPVPKIRSAVVRLRFHARRPAVRDPKACDALVRAAFTWRRKTLTNALVRYAGSTAPQVDVESALAQAGIDGRRRPETLSIGEFARLSDAWAPRAVL